jgi:hypothetical protein
VSADDEAIRRLLTSDDQREVMIGLDLAADLAPSVVERELGRLADDDRPDVRLVALSRIPDAGARSRLRDEMKWALEASDVQVRRAALDAVNHGDREHVMAVIVALMDPMTAGAAAGALERLGDLAAPAVTSILARAKVPAPAYAARIVRCTRFTEPVRESVLAPHAGHADRELGLAVLQSLVADEVSPSLAATINDVLVDDATHEQRIVDAHAAVARDGAGHDDGDGTDVTAMLRALDDELVLIRRRIACARLALHAPGPATAPAAPRSDRTRDDTLRELVDDPDRNWRSEWLREVARFTLDSLGR